MHITELRRKVRHIDTVQFVRKTLQQLLARLIMYCTVGPVTIDLLAEDTLCTRRTPARTTPDVWPPFPIVMTSIDYPHPKSGEDNTMAMLEHNDRVCETKLWFISSSLWGKVLHSDAGAIPDRFATHLRCMICDVVISPRISHLG